VKIGDKIHLTAGFDHVPVATVTAVLSGGVLKAVLDEDHPLHKHDPGGEKAGQVRELTIAPGSYEAEAV
jgi:hypothetical protein